MLNRNVDKYNLNHIWDRVPFNTPGLKIGSPKTYQTYTIMVKLKPIKPIGIHKLSQDTLSML